MTKASGLAQAISAAGHVPVAPQADYPQLYPVRGAADALALAVRLEDGCAAAWRYLYLQAATPAPGTPTPGTPTPGTPTPGRPTPGSLRATAQDALTASAVRATQWRAITTPTSATVAFPGI